MANSIDQLQYTKTITSLYAAAANSSNANKTPAPSLDQTPGDRGTESLRVELSEQGRMQAAARNKTEGQQPAPAEPSNRAAANLQKFGSELAAKAAGTDLSAGEKTRLNEQMTAVNKALAAMGENAAPAAPNTTSAAQATTANNQPPPAAPAAETSGRSTTAGLMTRGTDKARAALEAMQNFSAATGPNPMSQSAAEAGTRQRISIVI